jgi:Fanconi anemia group M protein
MQQFLEPPKNERVTIAIDQREDETFDQILKGLGADIDRRVLSVGDFLCSARLVVERKTRADFEQSIIDGRLFSQLPNLVSNYPRVLVVVEGTSDEGRINHNALLGAYSTIIADFGVSLMFTRNLEKTAELVFALAKHEQRAKKQPMRIFAKRKTLTISQSQRAITEVLPMVGPKLARALLEHFGSVEHIFSATEEELLAVDGMGPKRAKIIRAIISKEYNAEEDEMKFL